MHQKSKITTGIAPLASATPTEVTIFATLRQHLTTVRSQPWLWRTWLAQSHTLLQRFTRLHDQLRRQPRHVRRRWQRQLGTSLAGVALALALANMPAQAASITVDSTTCTLIDAITAANTDTATGGCTAGSGADTITLTADVTLTAVNNDDSHGYSGLPVMSSVITLDGNGHTIRRDSGAPAFRILNIGSGGNLTLEHATISGGKLDGPGAGIFVHYGTLTVNNSTISGNQTIAGGAGGGILGNYGSTVTLNNSTISGNTAAGIGGGVVAYGQPFGGERATLTINGSTITGNSANTAGGLWVSNGGATLIHSLISGNPATNNGKEIYVAPFGSSTVTAANSNLFGHSGETNAQAFYGFTPGGSDIIATSNGSKPTALTSILNTTLADNGGDTFTHALVAGSPAIDAAGDGTLTTDQRGVARPQGAADDIGAFEVKSLNSSVAQGTPTTANNATPQNCAAAGTNLAIYTINNPITNSSATTFTDLFFRVKQLEYTTPNGQQLSLCNATTVVNNGGVGSMLAVPNSSLPGGNSQFNPGETFTQAFQIGRPVAAQFRIKFELFSNSTTAASVGGRTGEEYLGSFEYVIDEQGQLVGTSHLLFLPVVTR